MYKSGESVSTSEIPLEVAPDLLERQRFLTDEDHLILNALRPVVVGLARYWGSHCEVILHSLEDLAHSIIQIENGVITGRSVGAPVTDLALQILKEGESGRKENDDFEIYFAKSSKGVPLRSITMIIRNANRPIGMLCINFDLTVPLCEILKIFAPDEKTLKHDKESPEHFPISAENLVSKSIDTAIGNAMSIRGISSQQRNRLIVTELRQQGIFDIKGAVEIVGTELGVSRFTIYNYLRNIKQEGDQD